jgi:hypothetical protein
LNEEELKAKQIISNISTEIYYKATPEEKKLQKWQF